MTLCPRCKEDEFTPYGETYVEGGPARPALSRADNKTYICSECGTEEAMLDFVGRELQQPEEWPVKA